MQLTFDIAVSILFSHPFLMMLDASAVALEGRRRNIADGGGTFFSLASNQRIICWFVLRKVVELTGFVITVLMCLLCHSLLRKENAIKW